MFTILMGIALEWLETIPRRSSSLREAPRVPLDLHYDVDYSNQNFYNESFSSCRFKGGTLKNCKLFNCTFDNVKIENCSLHVSSSLANNCQVSNSVFDAPEWYINVHSIDQGNIQNSKIFNAKISHSIIFYSQIDNSKLINETYTNNCDVYGSEIDGAIVSYSNITFCIFRKPNIVNSNLKSSRFYDCPNNGVFCEYSQLNANFNKCPYSEKCIPWVPPITPTPHPTVSASATTTQSPTASHPPSLISFYFPPTQQIPITHSVPEPEKDQESIHLESEEALDNLADRSVTTKESGSGLIIIISSVCSALIFIIIIIIAFFTIRRKKEVSSYSQDEDSVQTILHQPAVEIEIDNPMLYTTVTGVSDDPFKNDFEEEENRFSNHITY